MSLIRDNTQLDNLPNFCIKKEKKKHSHKTKSNNSNY